MHDPRLAITNELLSEYKGGSQLLGPSIYGITVIAGGTTHSQAIDVVERLILTATMDTELPAGRLIAVSADRMTTTSKAATAAASGLVRSR
jgi:hypothetical protein